MDDKNVWMTKMFPRQKCFQDPRADHQCIEGRGERSWLKACAARAPATAEMFSRWFLVVFGFSLLSGQHSPAAGGESRFSSRSRTWMGCAVPGEAVPPPGRKREPLRPLPRKTSPNARARRFSLLSLTAQGLFLSPGWARLLPRCLLLLPAAG